MSTGLEHSLWLIVLHTVPSSSVLECALLLLVSPKLWALELMGTGRMGCC